MLKVNEIITHEALSTARDNAVVALLLAGLSIAVITVLLAVMKPSELNELAENLA